MAGERRDEALSAGTACLCGCGQEVGRGSRYRPGHDARHAGTVGRALVSLGREDEDLLAGLPTADLRAKALSMLASTRGRRADASAAVRPPSTGTGPARSVVVPGPVTVDGADLPAGRSTEQQDAEAVMLGLLSVRLGVDLARRRVHLPDGSYADLDGVCDDPPVLVEAWAHQGPPIGGQRNKVLADALKLTHVSGQLGRGTGWCCA